jgi:hypothetical protein
MSRHCPVSLVRRAAAAFLVAVTAACATGHSSSGADANGAASVVSHDVVVDLTNDAIPASDVTVYAVGSGVRRMVGSVPPGGERTLRFKAPAGSAPFRLVAERQLARPIASQRLTAAGQMLQVNWSLRNNSMWFPKESGQ